MKAENFSTNLKFPVLCFLVMAINLLWLQNSYLPVIVQIVAVLVTGVFLFGGIRWIERANMILVPLLLCIVIFTFGWSLTREYAEVGIAFLLTPSWSKLGTFYLIKTMFDQHFSISKKSENSREVCTNSFNLVYWFLKVLRREITEYKKKLHSIKLVVISDEIDKK